MKWVNLGVIFCYPCIRKPPHRIALKIRRKLCIVSSMVDHLNLLDKLFISSTCRPQLPFNLGSIQVSCSFEIMSFRSSFLFFGLFHGYWITFYSLTFWRRIFTHLLTLIWQMRWVEKNINFKFLLLTWKVKKEGLLKLPTASTCWQ